MNRFSPFTAEIDDEPFPRVPPHPPGVLVAVHPAGESDTDKAEFHAIHTPAGSDGSSPFQSDSGEEVDDDIGGNSEQEDAEEASTFDPPHEDIARLALMSHVLQWQEDSGVWIKSLWTLSSGAGVV